LLSWDQRTETHEEVLQLCQSLGTHTPSPSATRRNGPPAISSASSQATSRGKLAAAISGEVPWNDPDFVSAIATPLWRWPRLLFQPFGAISYDDANLLFYSGQAAMTLTGNWMMSDYTDPDVMPDPVGFFFYPSIDGGPIVPPAGVGWPTSSRALWKTQSRL